MHGWLTYAYEVLRDWGSLIGGLLALYAGRLAYVAGKKQAEATKLAGASQVDATRLAADAQIDAMAHKDHLQALGIVVSVYNGLLEMQEIHKKVTRSLNDNITPKSVGGGSSFVNLMSIRLPPLIADNVDYFYLVTPGGFSLIQVVGITAQYNRLLESYEWNPTPAPEVYAKLGGHLKAIGLVLKDALRDIEPLHDEAIPDITRCEPIGLFKSPRTDAD